MNTNLRGPYFLTQRLSRWMVELRKTLADYSPVIVNIVGVGMRIISQPGRLLFDEGWNCDDDATVRTGWRSLEFLSLRFDPELLKRT
jgi:NAD(P)-dependent dehydrogenase (short-subunit alcohol dehydrogenase family)